MQKGTLSQEQKGNSTQLSQKIFHYEEQFEQSLTYRQYSEQDYTRISQCLNFVEQSVNQFQLSHIYKNAIIIIDSTENNKSTLVNYLAGQTLKIENQSRHSGIVTQDTIVPNDQILLLPTIINPINNEKYKETSIICIPGYTQKGIIDQMIIEQQRQIIAKKVDNYKYLIVISEEDLKSENCNGQKLKESFQKLQIYLLKQLQQDSISSIGIIVSITYGSTSNASSQIYEYIKTIISKQKQDGQFLTILKSILDKQNISYFSKPQDNTQDGELYAPTLENQNADLEKLIIEQLQFQQIIHPEAQDSNYHLLLDQKKKVDIALKILIQKGIYSLKGQLESWKTNKVIVSLQELEQLNSLMESFKEYENMQLLQFASNLNDNTYFPKLNLSLLQNLQQEIHCLAQFTDQPQEQNWVQLVNLVDEYIEPIRNELCSLLNQQEKIFPNNGLYIKDNILYYRKYNICLSDIKKNIEETVSNNPQIKVVRLFALNKIEINCDLRLPGVNLSIFAQQWAIIFSTQINLSGKHETQYPNNIQKQKNGESFGAQGYNGEPGLPGQSSGNFIGVGNYFRNAQYIKLNLSGGRGGPGQDGGDGNGDNSGFNQQQLGDGGLGGAGGMSGYKGNYQLYQLSNQYNIQDNKIELQKVYQFEEEGYKGMGGKGGGSYDIGTYLINKFLNGKIQAGRDGIDGENFYRQQYPEKIQDLILSEEINQFINFTLEVNKNIQRIDILGSSFMLNIRSIYRAESIDYLIENCFILQKNLSQQNSDTIKYYYYDLQKYINDYYKNNLKSLDQQDVQLLNYLYSLCECTITRINSLNDTVIVIDIVKYLELAKFNIEQNQKLKLKEIKQTYKDNYENNINQKIEEAQKFTKDLQYDIEDYQDSMNGQIKSLIDEILEIQQTLRENNKDLEEKKKKLQEQLSTIKLFGILKISSKLLCLAGPEGVVASQIIGNSLEIGEGFAIDKVDVVTDIPKNISSSLQSMNEVISDVSKEEQTNILIDIHKEQKLEKQGKSTFQKSEYYNTRIGVLKRSQDYKNSKEKQNQVKFYEDKKKRAVKEEKRQIEIRKKKAEQLEKQQSVRDTRDKISGYVGKAQNVSEAAQTGMQLYKDINNQEDKIKLIESTIASNYEMIEKFNQSIQTISTVYYKVMNNTKDQILQVEENLQNSSKVGQLVQGLKLKLYLNDVQIILEKLSNEFKSQQQLLNLFNKVKQSMQTMIEIYTQIEAYKDQAQFASYISSLVSSDLDSSVVPQKYERQVNQLKIQIQNNIISEMYNRALKSFIQWSFPYSRYYFSQIQDLSPQFQIQLNEYKPEPNYSQMSNVLQQLLEQVKLNQATVCPKKDNTIQNEKFEFDPPYTPFIEWNYEGHQVEFNRLVNGKAINIFADINEVGRKYLDAVKFSRIRLNIRYRSDPQKDKELQEILKYFYVELTHSGDNFYKVKNNLYKIQSSGPFQDKIVLKYGYSDPNASYNDTIKKIQNNSNEDIPLLSPYTLWTIQLSPINQQDVSYFVELTNYLDNNFSLSLVGMGQYVNVSDDIFEPLNYQAYQVDNSQVIISQELQIYSQQQQDEQEHLQELNLFSARNNLDYQEKAYELYQVQKQILSEYSEQIDILYPIEQENEENSLLQTVLNLATEQENQSQNQITLQLFRHQDSKSWIPLASMTQKDGKILVYIFDSQGYFDTEIKQPENIEKIEIMQICYPQTLIPLISGVFALQNSLNQVKFLLNEGKNLLFNNQQQSWDVNQSQQFLEIIQTFKYCTLDQALKLKKNYFPNIYIKSQAERLQQDMQIQDIVQGQLLPQNKQVLEELKVKICDIVKDKYPQLSVNLPQQLETTQNLDCLSLSLFVQNLSLQDKRCKVAFQLDCQSSDIEDKYILKELYDLMKKELSGYNLDLNEEVFCIDIFPDKGLEISDIQIPSIKPVQLNSLMNSLNIEPNNLSNSVLVQGILRQFRISYQ